MLLWIAIPAAAVAEMGYHEYVQGRIPRDCDWHEAEKIIEAGHEQGDLVVINPWWASQGWKYLGRFMSVEQMAREDDTGYGRIWEVALPGRKDEGYERDGKLVVKKRAGRLTVRLWQFPDAPLDRYDFVKGLEKDATVSMVGQGGKPVEPCTFHLNPMGSLVPNAAVQSGRFRCDPRIPWNTVAREVIADLANKPRLCIWAHPVDGKRVRIEFAGVPAGSIVVGHTGLKYEADRETAAKPPMFVEISAAGKVVGSAMHEQGGGWTPFRIDLGPAGTGGHVGFEVFTQAAGMQHFCFSAKLRDR